jgi:hypothetical protein
MSLGEPTVFAADCTAAAVSTVSQKACTDTRGAGAM